MESKIFCKLFRCLGDFVLIGILLINIECSFLDLCVGVSSDVNFLPILH